MKGVSPPMIPHSNLLSSPPYTTLIAWLVSLTINYRLRVGSDSPGVTMVIRWIGVVILSDCLIAMVIIPETIASILTGFFL